ncbi:MAG: S8 family serine peptidase [Rhodothermales bacterium]|nr:S8 family serine peptidase [Rhodothermales bacterium]MBO6781587.1 S8 family serine peptidase [Rhodothermales bacterium]
MNHSRYMSAIATLLVAGVAGCAGFERPEPRFELAGFTTHSDADLWNVVRSGGAAPVNGRVCILDSGVDLNHPDLNVSKELSRSFVSRGPEQGDPHDYNGHGTHVAGIVAAIDNGIGVTGIASGATVVAIKVVNKDGQGYTGDVLAGIRYAASRLKDGQQLCDVVNFSIGAAADKRVDKAVRRAAKRVPFVASAGNKGRHVRDFSPARLNAKNVYTVTAIARGDRWPMFSNFGSTAVDFAAPGVRVRSTWKDGGYKTISGTSAAAAHVTGMLLRGGMLADGIVMDPRGDAYMIPVAPPVELEPALASAEPTSGR